MAIFTDDQIQEIINIFTQNVASRQYIGARYVPIFGRKNEDSIIWDNSGSYEPLTIVLYQGNSYTSRQYVPAGIDILNREFWANTGNYNAQIEQYRNEVINSNNLINNIENVIPINEFSSTNTVKNYIDTKNDETNTNINNVNNAINDTNNAINDTNNAIDNIENIIPINEFSSTNTVKNYIDEHSVKSNYLNIRKYIDAINGVDSIEQSGTSDEPYKTLQFAYDLMVSNGYQDVRFTFKESGVYTLNGYSINIAALHLNAEVANVTVIFYNNNNSTDEACGIYGTHINISGISKESKINISVGNNAELYFDNCLVTMVNVNCTNNLTRMHGGSCRINNCEFVKFYANGSSLWFTGDINIHNTSDNIAILLRACIWLCLAHIYADNIAINNNNTRFIQAICCHIKFDYPIPENTLTNKYYYNIEATAGTFLAMNSTQYNESANNSLSGNNFIHGTSLVINGDIINPS